MRMPTPISGSTVHAGLSQCEIFDCYGNDEAPRATHCCWRISRIGDAIAKSDTWIVCDQHDSLARSRDWQTSSGAVITTLYLPLLLPDGGASDMVAWEVVCAFQWLDSALGETDPDVAMGRARWGGARATEVGL